MDDETDIVVFEAPLGSDLYRQALALREAILRRPIGLTISAEELADDETRQHFCALWLGRVVGSVSLKPLGEALVQLKQMGVAQERQRRGHRAAASLARRRLGQDLWLPPHRAQRQTWRRGLLRGLRLPFGRRALRGEHAGTYQNDQAPGLISLLGCGG